VVIAQSVKFARGLRATEFVFVFVVYPQIVVLQLMDAIAIVVESATHYVSSNNNHNNDDNSIDIDTSYGLVGPRLISGGGKIPFSTA
jgi:hypothetical protein